MDTITHTLGGYLLGQFFASFSIRRKRSVIAASVIANNFPDADVFYASFLSEPLGYLLHHRGHTHTLLGAGVCGIFVFIPCSGFLLSKKENLPWREAFFLLFVSVFGALFHLALDSLNTYGVHPFWPLNSSWYFGDSIFIIEPLLWCSLALASRPFTASRSLRWALDGALLFGVGIILFSGLVPPVLLLLYALSGFLLYSTTQHLSPRLKSATWSAISCSIVVVFVIVGNLARVGAAEQDERPTESLISKFTGPSPSNPLCWSELRIERKPESVLYTQRFHQPFHSLVSVNCAKYSLFRSPENYDLNSVQWEVPLEWFQAARNSCRWQAFLSFSRAPTILSDSEGRHFAADVRFSGGQVDGFSSVALDGNCPAQLPAWKPIIESSQFR